MTNREIFSNLNNVTFPEKYSGILSLLSQHENQIRFVKDFLGFPNFLFISEYGAYFEYPNLFACFNLKADIENMASNIYEIDQNKFVLPDDIQTYLTNFLSDDNHILYVIIGFKCSMLSNKKLQEVYKKIGGGEEEDIYIASFKTRTYPDWYNVPYSFDMHAETVLNYHFSELERRLLLLRKSELYHKIKSALSQNDRFSYKKYQDELSLICNELDFFSKAR